MAELTKQALKVANNTEFPNNNNGAITPSNLRTFNEDMIDSTVNQAQYTTDSGSWNQQIDALESFSSSLDTNFASQAEFNSYTSSNNQRVSSLETATSSFVTSAITASSLITASFDNGTRNLTFTKGDAYTFAVNIPDVSGSAGDFVTTASFNAYTTSVNTFITSSEMRLDLIEDFTQSAQISIDNLNSATGSFATTGSNTFNGNQIINGLTTINVGAAATETQKDFIVVTGSVINTIPYTNVTFGLQDYPSFGDNFKDAFVFDYWDSLSYNYGAAYQHNGIRTGTELLASGSGNSFGGKGYGINQLRVLGTGSFLNQYASIINIGSFAPSTTDFILIGHNALPYLQLSSLNNQITGSTTISGSNGLRVIGNQTITGSLTISGSAATDLNVIGNSVFTGNTTITGSTPSFTIRGTNGVTTQFSDSLSISSSLYRNLQGPRGIEFLKSTFDYNTFLASYTGLSSSFLSNFTDNLSATASYTVGVFDNGFTQDVELSLETTTTNGILFKDIRSDTGAYVTFLKIAPNGGTNPPLEFKRGMQITGSLSIQSGSAFFANGNRQFNVGAFTSLVSQSGSANVSQSMNFETTDISSGVSIVSNSQITLANSGTYNIQFSAQVLADTGADDVYIWLKKNGTNVAASAGHAVLSNNSEQILSWNYVVDTVANDYYELCWQSTQGDAILLAEAASGNIPSIPSVILTVTQVR